MSGHENVAGISAEQAYERYKRAVEKLLVPSEKFREFWEDIDCENREWWLRELEANPSGLVRFKQTIEMDL